MKYLSIVLAIILLNSCALNIEKRKYNKGWHLSKTRTVLGGGNDNVELTSENTKTTEKKNAALELKNEEVYQIHNETVVNESNKSIHQKTTINTPTHQEETEATLISLKEVARTGTKKSLKKKYSKLLKATNTDGEERGSQMIALLLCIFAGAIGIHRFYLGYTGIGILQLCTLGCCGIWTLIDLIRIITGDLKPKNAEYAEPFEKI